MKFAVKQSVFATLALALAASLSASADGIFVGYSESATNRVDSGTSVQTAPIAHAGTGSLYKLGEGTWEIPENALKSPSLSLGVLAGSVSLAPPSANSIAVEAPTAVLNKAVLWLDAGISATRTEVSSNGCVFVDRWSDVRDAGASTPTHLYAEANHALSAFSPEYMVQEGRNTIWFGGMGSNRTMNWKKSDGTQFSDRSIRHVFCVHGIDKTWGYLFGTLTKYPYFATSYVGSNMPKLGLLWSYGGCPDIVNARTQVNGIPVNPQNYQMEKGFQLLDVDMGRDAAWIENFFNDRNNSNSSAGYRIGGDYICECVAFTNVLTDAERVEIEAYLMDKWQVGQEEKSHVIAVAEGASVEVPCATERSLSACVFQGKGLLRKTGNGVLNLNSKGTELSDTAVKVEGGTVALNKTYPLALSAGDRVTANVGTNGPRVTVTADAPAGTIVKDGNDSVVLRSVPANVTRLQVNAGEVALTQPSAEDAIESADEIEIPVPNGGFEEWDAADKAVGYKEIPTDGTVHGWTAPGSSSNAAFFYRRPSGVRSVMNSWDCMAWQVEGESYFVLSRNRELYTTVDLPSAGTYELSFWAATRYAQRAQGPHLDIFLDDVERDVSVKVGRSIVVQDDPFFRQTHRVTVDKGGAWRLRFKGLCPSWGSTFLDDIHLRRVPERQETCWKIPDGDFENVTYAASSDALAMKAGNVQPGWTLSGSVYYTARAIDSGSGDNRVHGVYHNDSRFPAGGFSELFFLHTTAANDATATTTFCPPAGTWVLVADMAGYRQSEGGELPWATVEIGDETLNLGTNTAVVAGTFGTYSFPKAFTVDGNQNVTLVFGMHTVNKSANVWDNTTGYKAGLVVDNLRLIPGGDGLELVQNGGFENGATGWTKVNTGAGSSTNEKVMDTISANWTLEYCEGTHYHVLAYSNFLAQAVTFPAAGHYRLSWHSHCRYDARTSTYAAQMNPDVAWIERNGVKTVIGRGLNNASWFTQHTFDFDVPEAGEYTFGLQGANGGSGSYAYMTQHLIDNISIKRIGDSSAVSTMLPADLRLVVAEGARVQLGFSGVNRIGSLRLGGESVIGTVSAQTHPDYFYGTGELQIVPAATRVFLR